MTNVATMPAPLDPKPRGPYDTRFLLHEREEAYRKAAAEHLTSHALADFRKCPLLYWKKRCGIIPDEDTAAYLVGRAAHTLILEGQDRFEGNYAVGGPVNPKTGLPFGRNTKAFEEWATGIGKDVLTDDQYAVVANMASSLDAHPFAIELLAHGVPEGTVRAAYAGLSCQSRIDWFSPIYGIVDIKTCDDMQWFEADARRFQYANQMAFYQAVVERATGKRAGIHIIAIEKKEPYRCGVWRFADSVLDAARRENEAAIARLVKCNRSDSWPTGFEEVRTFDYI